MNELNYTILRGGDKIGGNIITVWTDDANILVEFGKELDNNSSTLTELEKDIVNTKFDACFITHYHGDHAANISELTCPVYMGKKCKAVMETMAAHRQVKLPKDIRTFDDGEVILINGVRVTPYLCDHSALDSYMFKFERYPYETILYTGDWRTNGRKSFGALLKKLPTDIDVLITENTNANRAFARKTEEDLEREAVKVFNSTDKPIFILQSTTNFDRVVSFYKAANTAKRKFYIDGYQSKLCKSAGEKIPSADTHTNVEAVVDLTSKSYPAVKHIKKQRTYTSVAKESNYVMLIRQSHIEHLKKMVENGANFDGSILVYSMWSGYKETESMKAFLAEIKKLGINEVTLHASGHADAVSIDKLIKHTNPKQIEYVHCENNEEK